MHFDLQINEKEINEGNKTRWGVVGLSLKSNKVFTKKIYAIQGVFKKDLSSVLCSFSRLQTFFISSISFYDVI